MRVIAEHGVRGLRVAQLSAEAGVSTALIYYHFTDRDGILRAALEYINERAQDYTTPSADSHPRTQLESMLLDELQDTDEVRTASVAWGELRASAASLPPSKNLSGRAPPPGTETSKTSSPESRTPSPLTPPRPLPG